MSREQLNPSRHLPVQGIARKKERVLFSPWQQPERSPRFPGICVQGCREKATLIIANYCSRADSTHTSSAAPSPPRLCCGCPRTPAAHGPQWPTGPGSPRTPAAHSRCTVPGDHPHPSAHSPQGNGDKAQGMRPRARGLDGDEHHHPKPEGTVLSHLLLDALFISLNDKGAARTPSFPQTTQSC